MPDSAVTSVHTAAHQDTPAARSTASIASAETAVNATTPQKPDALEKGSDILHVGWYGSTDEDDP
ncbi:hypothetical protein FA95DRAFT_1552359 [Auriscalpium vulgare]|uniref:Uncharacterized protein n=1 Tax=Auriscalpium vulgare TaxID=40419 RepID=A0ACB8SB03_9AGAM|nr:hypothetical protein FA95DRAFT_1552359 [Auriscalpium vulgare]